jgi:beta-glucanase (GH16 family)
MNIKKTAVKSALAVAAAAAALTTNVSAKDFSGAELYTLEEVQYGKFEARMKMAAAS